MRKINTATLTFHASHNYGSMLQAYALQRVLIEELSVNNEIINFRSDTQKRMYQNPVGNKLSWKQKFVKYILGDNEKGLVEKYNLFEKFLNDRLVLSQEFNNEEDVSEYSCKFDYLISGSDQIWNTNCYDFNWMYYLPFARKNAVAYAPSMGPDCRNQVKHGNYSRIAECLQQYVAISVREQASADIINSISNKEAKVLIDPTLLIGIEQWNELSGRKPLIEGEYIFMYKPVVNTDIYKITLDISRKLGLPVIVSNKIPPQIELKNLFLQRKRLQQKLDVGPIEFLNLLKNAKFVISGSFHAVVFSIIFNKPFLALGGKTDNRMSQLLKATSLLDYGVDKENYLEALRMLDKINFENAEAYIKKERSNSLSFIKNALNL